MSIDVLLVNPPLSTVVLKLRPGSLMPPLGLAYLGAVLEQANYAVEIVDMQAENLRGADLLRLVQERRPRVVGIGTMVNTYNNGLRAAQLVKAALPSAKVVVGGPQATFLVDDTLSCPDVDVVVLYEGEVTILELMQHFDGHGPAIDQVQGVAFRDGDRIHRTGFRPLIADLDNLPFPARHLFNLDCYGLPIVITGRGCPSNCVFCAANTLYPKPKYRYRSPQFVVDEIEQMFQEYGINSFFIADDNFTLYQKRAMEICDLLIERGLHTLRWLCEARVDTMTPELARKLKVAGCVEVQYGVETGNPEMMKRIRKGIKLEQVEEVVNYSQAIGLNVVCSFIIGFPWDTAETVRQTIEFGHKLSSLGAPLSDGWRSGRGRVGVGFAPLTPLPGTHVYDHAEELGIRFLTKDWDRYTFGEPVIETRHLTAAQIRNYHMMGFR